ncbi:MAG: stage V sporulation protein AD [Acutalibacteraceae bacterium]
MSRRIGKQTVVLENNIAVIASAGICGSKESQGPLGKFFDRTYTDDRLGQDSWEKAESYLQTTAVNLAIKKAGLENKDMDFILAGDLLDQCISSTFGLRDLGIPFLGQYGACSTMAQTIAVSAMLVDGGAAQNCVAVTSSHFCSAERQFRFPLEYGGQRTPTAQWTVTGAGAAIVAQAETGVKIKAVTIGKITDLGITDANNMGAAMAPAAAETITAYFRDTQKKPSDFDLILTGDLGLVGSKLLGELLQKENIDISDRHNDCGLMIFDLEKQDVHAGGSGCGCSGSVLCSYIMKQMMTGQLTNILFVATGALMSPTSSQQGESIPGIAHLIHFYREC